jgi:hypothetical protein
VFEALGTAGEARLCRRLRRSVAACWDPDVLNMPTYSGQARCGHWAAVIYGGSRWGVDLHSPMFCVSVVAARQQ